MMKYNLKIELLSDLCVSDGGSYNSFIDTDVCYDTYGFPYIPSKRLKGCFRESCLELNDWGKQIPLEELFGTEGKEVNKAKFTISNAYLENVEQYKKIIDDSNNLLLFHPQNVLSKYTYVRYQTSVDYETGSAKDHSLRTIRVVNKGNVFVSEIEMDEKYFNYFEQIVSITTNIGINRTRGLGEVKISIYKKDDIELNNTNTIQIDDNSNKLYYHIDLKEPIVCKGFNSNDLNTMDYIEGNKILGVIAGGLKKEGKDFVEFLNKDELFISNAYIEYNGHRMGEMPASYYTFKNEKNFCYDSSQYIIKDEDKDKQPSKMKHSYIYLEDGKLHKSSIAISNSYHHSRPEDKSYGHSLESNDESSKFFAISSINEGQRFGGFITGSHEQIETIYNILNNKECRMGFGRSSEFGKVRIIVDKPEEASSKQVKGKKIAVKLESPAIIYGENASYSVNKNDLIKEINNILDIDEKVVPAVYLNLTTIGGFNVTWGCRKPIIQAFDKGTVLVYEFNNDTEITLNSKTYIGERIQEGFGEISICELNDLYQKEILLYKDNKNVENKSVDGKQIFVKELADSLFNEFLNFKVRNCFKEKHREKESRPVVANMLLMFKDNSLTLEKLNKTVNKRFDRSSEKKQQKLQVANDIIKHCENSFKDIVSEFNELYNLKDFDVERDVMVLDFIHKYLYEMKYEIRSKEATND